MFCRSILVGLSFFRYFLFWRGDVLHLHLPDAFSLVIRFITSVFIFFISPNVKFIISKLYVNIGIVSVLINYNNLIFTFNPVLNITLLSFVILFLFLPLFIVLLHSHEQLYIHICIYICTQNHNNDTMKTSDTVL